MATANADPLLVAGADAYLCVGICMADPDSGYCLGCGRPPLAAPADAIVAEAAPLPLPQSAAGDPDSPR